MTQANNVGIGSSQFNSSGVLQVAGGGTGMSTGYPIATTTNLANNPVTGTPSSSNYLRGDGTWQTVSVPTSSQLAQAWVRFLGGTGSPLTITKAYNVSSVTRTALGKYVVNFTTNLADADYTVVASSSSTQSAGIFALPFYTAAGTAGTPTTSSFPILYLGINGAPFDIDYGNIAVFD